MDRQRNAVPRQAASRVLLVVSFGQPVKCHRLCLLRLSCAAIGCCDCQTVGDLIKLDDNWGV